MHARHDFESTALDSAWPLIQGLTHVHDAVILVDEEGRLAWISEALDALCGGAHGYLGEPLEALLSDASRARELAAQLETKGRLSGEDVEIVGGDGRLLRASVSAARLGPPGSRAPAVAILRMHGETTRPGSDSADRHRLLAALLDAAPDGVVAVDSSRFITYVNPALEALTGWSRKELLDKPIALFVRSAEELERIAEALDPDRPVRNYELELRRRDGSSAPVSVSASEVILPDGTALGTVAYLREVGRPLAPERRLAERNADLEHTLNSLAHDLRSPLVSLLGFTRLLRDDYSDGLDERGVHFLSRIEQAGHTMESLIHDLLELSRIERNQTPAATWVDPRPVLQQLAAELKQRLDGRGVALELPADPPLVRCDRTRLYQIFSNLLGNALEHMDRARDACVRVHVRERADAHELEVTDNGRGIDPVHHSRIFQVFQTLGSRKDGRKGTGMGLAIVKKIAQSQGGDVRVESRVGEGARFVVRLPR